MHRHSLEAQAALWSREDSHRASIWVLDQARFLQSATAVERLAFTTTGANSRLKTPALKVTRHRELPIPQYVGHMPRDTEHSHGQKYVMILDMDLLPISEGPMSAVKENMLSSADFVGSRQC